MKPRIVHVIEVFLGWERPTWTPAPDWIEHRIPFFKRFTIPSLRNQTACQVQILIQASPGPAVRLAQETWKPGITLCTDRGRTLYGGIDADYLAITRMDSDDMMHREAMAEVKAATLQLTMDGRRKDQRQVLRFPDYFTWDQVNGFLRTPGKRPPSTPFYTHIFGRKMVNDWDAFDALHFQPHGKGSGDKGALELRPDRICVIKHGQNTSVLKHGKKWLTATAEWAQERCGDQAKIVSDPEGMAKILDEFLPGATKK